MAKSKGMNHEPMYVFLNDGETFTNLSGCTLVKRNNDGSWSGYDLFTIAHDANPTWVPDAEVTEKMLYELEEDFAG